jgi:hypothetical protein
MMTRISTMADAVVQLRDLISETDLVREHPGLLSRKTLKAMRRNQEIRWIVGDDELFYPRGDVDRVLTSMLQGKEPECPAPTPPSSTEATGSAESRAATPGIGIGGKVAASVGRALASKI